MTQWWADRSLRNKGLIVIAIPLLMLLIIMPSFIITQRYLWSAQMRIAHTLRVGHEISHVLALQLDAETGVRGYLLTKNTIFLQPYTTARAQLPTATQNLTTLVQDNPQQEERAQQAATLVASEMALLDTLQSAAARGEEPAPAQLITSKSQMDSLREVLAAMTREEERLLQVRTQEVQRLATRGQWIEGVAVLLALVGGLLATLLFTGGVVRRIQRLGGIAQRLGQGYPPEAARPDADEIGALERELFTAGQLLNTREASLREAATILERRVEERTEALHEELRARQQAEVALHETNTQLTGVVQMLERQARDISMLNELGDYLQSCRTTEEAATVIRRLGGQLFPGSTGFVGIFRASQNLIEPVASWGEAGQTFADFAPEACWALRRGRSHQVVDPASDLPCAHAPESHIGGYLCLPLLADGEMLGILHLRLMASDSTIDETAQQRLTIAVAERVGLALANLRMQARLRDQSIRDPLTGLYNRRYLEESLERELQRAERQGAAVSVIMVDLDHFKRFNDTFGHQAGDALLREVGSYLGTHIRGEDFACRYGGEELTLILPGANLSAAEARAETLRNGLRDLTVLHQRRVLGPITASIGVAAFPIHGQTTEAVLRAADSSLYRAKREGRDRIVLAS
ncbi:MAG TPA: diguanylate cyclase [Thermomicrobiales bacterium]